MTFVARSVRYVLRNEVPHLRMSAKSAVVPHRF